MLTKASIDDCLCLAVKDLVKLGNSLPKWSGTMTWDVRGRVVSEVGVQYRCGSCVLSYSFEGVSYNQSINFSETPCHFGGSRKWFVCPKCYEKATKLRFLNGLFICTRCVGLGYKSQRINQARRFQNRAAKLKEQLGIDRPASLMRSVKDSDRPKGMHRTTFRMKKIRANAYLIKAIELW